MWLQATVQVRAERKEGLPTKGVVPLCSQTTGPVRAAMKEVRPPVKALRVRARAGRV